MGPFAAVGPGGPVRPQDPLQPRRVAIIAALTGASFALVALLTVLVGAVGSGEGDFDQEFLAACERSDAPRDRCRCALSRWDADLDAEARRDLDTALVGDGELPAELVSALQSC